MNTNEWVNVSRVEYREQERRMPQALERKRVMYPVKHRPGWLAKQTGRLRNTLASGLVTLSRHLDTEWDVSPEAPFQEQEVGS